MNKRLMATWLTIAVLTLGYCRAQEFLQQQSIRQNPCILKQTCHECIQTPSCSWCALPVRIRRKKHYSSMPLMRFIVVVSVLSRLRLNILNYFHHRVLTSYFVSYCLSALSVFILLKKIRLWLFASVVKST